MKLLTTLYCFLFLGHYALAFVPITPAPVSTTSLKRSRYDDDVAAEDETRRNFFPLAILGLPLLTRSYDDVHEEQQKKQMELERKGILALERKELTKRGILRPANGKSASNSSIQPSQGPQDAQPVTP